MKHKGVWKYWLECMSFYRVYVVLECYMWCQITAKLPINGTRGIRLHATAVHRNGGGSMKAVQITLIDKYAASDLGIFD